jgi:hypothetical protein
MIRPDFSLIVKDNEQAAAHALAQGDFTKAFLLVHALVEALLRLLLHVPDQQEVPFSNLIAGYRAYLEDNEYPFPTFVDELAEFNRRRNRVVHQLWRDGYSHTNRAAEGAAKAALIVYGLFIEWLETFDSEITRIGFRYDQSV